MSKLTNNILFRHIRLIPVLILKRPEIKLDTNEDSRVENGHSCSTILYSTITDVCVHEFTPCANKHVQTSWSYMSDLCSHVVQLRKHKTYHLTWMVIQGSGMDRVNDQQVHCAINGWNSLHVVINWRVYRQRLMFKGSFTDFGWMQQKLETFKRGETCIWKNKNRRWSLKNDYFDSDSCRKAQEAWFFF